MFENVIFVCFPLKWTVNLEFYMECLPFSLTLLPSLEIKIFSSDGVGRFELVFAKWKFFFQTGLGGLSSRGGNKVSENGNLKNKKCRKK
jgi:hypothetical protein